MKNKFKFKKYFKTFFPQDELIGIDIGSYALKIVLFSKEDGIKLKNWGYIPLNLKDDMDEAEKKMIISQEIENFIKKYNIKTKYAATSVSGNSIIIRYVKLPKMTKKELDISISVEAEAYIPFDINEVYISYYILDDNIMEEGQQKMEVVLVAAKKELIDDRIEILTNAGLIPVLIDVDSFALENLMSYIEANPGEDNKSVLLLNLGHRVTNLSILMNNFNLVNILEDNKKKKTPVKYQYYSRLVRDIFMGGVSIDKALAKKLGVDIDQVEEIKKTLRLLLTDEDKMEAIKSYDKILITSSNTISKVLKDLTQDITRSIDFFVSSGYEANIHKVYICGGTSNLLNLNMYLYDELKIPVEYLDPFSFLGEKPQNIPPYILRSLCVAAGLSLRNINDL